MNTIFQKFLGQPLEVFAAELWLVGLLILIAFLSFKFFMFILVVLLTVISIFILIYTFIVKTDEYPTHNLSTKQKGLDINET